jgi:hypothetical protein
MEQAQKSKVAVPKTEVLEQPHLTAKSKKSKKNDEE